MQRMDNRLLLEDIHLHHVVCVCYLSSEQLKIDYRKILDELRYNILLLVSGIFVIMKLKINNLSHFYRLLIVKRFIS